MSFSRACSAVRPETCSRVSRTEASIRSTSLRRSSSWSDCRERLFFNVSSSLRRRCISPCCWLSCISRCLSLASADWTFDSRALACFSASEVICMPSSLPLMTSLFRSTSASRRAFSSISLAADLALRFEMFSAITSPIAAPIRIAKMT